MGNISQRGDINTQDLLNAIFTYLTKELSIRDLIALSNYNECKKYVTFMANDMHRYFYEMKIFIQSGPKGILSFRKAKDLTEPQSSKDIDKQKGLCLVLAYFYARIFQIYGAIALTLLDDAEHISTITGTKPKPEIQKMGAITDRLHIPGSAMYKPRVKGGDIPSLDWYKCIESILDGYESSYGFKLKYTDTNTEIFFMPDKVNDSQAGKFKIIIGQSRYNIDVNMKDYRTDKYGLSFNKIYRSDTQSIIYHISIPNKEQTIKKVTDKWLIENEDMTTYFSKLFSRIITELKQQDTKKVEPKEYDDKKPIKEFDPESIIHSITQYRPIPHCIGRAMQLLTTKPFSADAVSNICKIQFVEKNNKTTRSGIPERGSAISSSPGLLALSRLFYDTISSISPKIMIGKENSYKQYLKFMEVMATRFGDKLREGKTRKTDSYSGDLDSIIDERDKYLCKDHSDSSIYVTPEGKARVQVIVNKLIDRHLTHARRCQSILNKLFNITNVGGKIHVAFNEKLIREGFDALNRITYETRELLIAYYEGCESDYIDGMQIVLKHIDKRTNVTRVNRSPNIGFMNTLRQQAGPILSERELADARKIEEAKNVEYAKKVQIATNRENTRIAEQVKNHNESRRLTAEVNAKFDAEAEVKAKIKADAEALDKAKANARAIAKAKRALAASVVAAPVGATAP
jgi:hypothetical protein